MTAISLALDMRIEATFDVTLSPLDAITRLAAPRGELLPAFTLDPVGPEYTYPNGRASGAYKTPADMPITFSASYTSGADADVYAVAYEWSFGDGTYATGPTVTHSYSLVNPNVRVSLCITDDMGVKRCVGRQLLLYAAEDVEVFVLFPETIIVADV